MRELNLTEKHKKTLDEFLQRLKSIYNQDLVSLILYGSAASNEFVDKNSNLNILVVLTNTDLDNLLLAQNMITKSKFARIHALFMTEEYIKSSLDVFPVEFLDMKENNIVLFGKDIFKGIPIETKNLRFQCEQELKSKLINLKQQYLRINPKAKSALANLLFRNFTSIIHILRNIVRLKGKTPSYLKEAIIAEVAIELKVEVITFMKILEAKKNPDILKREDMQSLLNDFVREIEKIIKVVDEI